MDDEPRSDEEEPTQIVRLSSIAALAPPEPKDRHLLVCVKGPSFGQVRRLDDRPLRIGRATDSELAVQDEGVSRRHALLLFEHGGYTLIDTSSANGTFVAGQRIQRHTLMDGDVVGFGPGVAFRYTLTDRGQEALLKQLFDASVTDPLTGSANREHFDTRLRVELSYARRHDTDLSLVLVDLDHFKAVNDHHGHPAGDEVLVQLAATARQIIRNEDLFARYGGEEFAIILRGIDVAGARSLAERLRSTVESLEIQTECERIRVTISAGCASLSELSSPEPEEFVRLADKRLYVAKRAGRNRVISEDGTAGA